MKQLVQPTPELRLGSLTLDDIPGVTVLEDLHFDPEEQKWVIKCRLRIDASSEFVPETTDWFILIDPEYPCGDIHFYPCKEKGIKVTFPHQALNWANDKNQVNKRWLPGFLCLRLNHLGFSTVKYSEEPRTATERLVWHCQQAIEWLSLAAQNSLLKPGDPYELPQPRYSSSMQVGYLEDRMSYEQWKNITETHGIVELTEVKTQRLWLATAFYGYKLVLKPVVGPLWERLYNKKIKGIWLRLPEPPIIQPWRFPHTLYELVLRVQDMGVDLLGIIQRYARHFRNGEAAVMLLGFPIPKTFGGTDYVLHWQAYRLPHLSTPKLHGYRPDERSLWSRDKQLLQSNRPVEWLDSVNWHYDEVSNRGFFPYDVRTKRWLLIGAGAIGSLFANSLIRSGVINLDIIDNDLLQIGNLTRHVLTLSELQRPKAYSLTAMLTNIFPYANVRGHAYRFHPSLPKEILDVCTEADVVVDTTGDDDVLHYMSKTEWRTEKIFASISVGYGARRLFVYLVKGTQFSSNDFYRLFLPWAEKERSEHSLLDFPWEGTGCWSPVFPARYDDISLMVSVAVKTVENFILNPSQSPVLYVYEQDYAGKEGIFNGVKLVAVHKGEINAQSHRL